MEKHLFNTADEPRGRRVLRGMARERVAIVRRYFDAWKANCLESLAHHVDPHLEIDWSDSFAPYRGVYTGHAGLLELFGEIRGAFHEASSDLHHFFVIGQHVAVPNTVRLRGRDGIEVVATSTVVFTFVGVTLVALRLYQRETDALAAIGAA
jgi:ketosteroid isomerase-like protein